MPELTVSGITKRFGGLTAVDQVSFDVGEGEIVAVIGPNGAGKSTLFNVVGGVFSPDAGRVLLDGRPIDRLKAHERVRLGIARTFQGAHAFPEMTVLENVLVGCQKRALAWVGELLLRTPRAVREEQRMVEAARELLDFVGLSVPTGMDAAGLTAGQQRLLAVARALATEPSLLLLDEPAAGLNTTEREQLAGVLIQLRARGMTILLVEHDMDFVMGLAERVVVLNYGRKLAEGTPEQVQRNPEVVAAYLGVDVGGEPKSRRASDGSGPAMAPAGMPTSGDDGDRLLEVRDVRVSYGQVEALNGLSLEVREREIVTVIGANGAGKTTLLNAISGVLEVTGGEICYQGQRLNGLTPRQVVQLGISQVPEGRQLFAGLTVQDHLMLGSYPRFIKDWRVWAGYWAYLGRRRELAEEVERMFALFPQLGARRRHLASSLSGGEQQMLAIARALMSHPRLLLLDEPSMGLAPMLVRDILAHLEGLQRQGLTVLLVEQNARQALQVADRGYALERGLVRLAGEASEMMHTEQVRRIYFGSGELAEDGRGVASLGVGETNDSSPTTVGEANHSSPTAVGEVR